MHAKKLYVVLSLLYSDVDNGRSCVPTIFRHEAELAAAAAQPLPDDDDDVFD